MSEKSFSQRLKNRETKEQLQKYYAMTESEYNRVLASLQDIRKEGGK
jgi:hypothetical protein